MVKRMSSLTIMFAVLMLAGSSWAHEKVIVVPLGGSKAAAKVGDVTAEYVLDGKTFSTETGTGVTGVMVDNGAVTIIPSTSDQAVVGGYHNGSGTVVGDTNLSSNNIKSSTTIFGIAGNPNVVDTSSGDAVAGDILSGKRAFVDGVEVIGSMVNNGKGEWNIKPGTIEHKVATGYWSSENRVVGDSDLVPENIPSGISLFGIAGTMKRAYINNGDGTLTSNAPTLTWQQADDGIRRTWAEAATYCEDLVLGDYDDWRLPGVYELWSLVRCTNGYSFSSDRSPNGCDGGASEPVIDLQFQCVAENYWTNDYNYNTYTEIGWAATINFDFGGRNFTSDTTPTIVRCVRADGAGVRFDYTGEYE